ncbi:hypothetical protein SEA_ZOOMAN_202 [Microbacterium phage Zooman]|nr:hypothetical protein SEA_ZOOMAN_202 [Microbacterium phage Zooman]
MSLLPLDAARKLPKPGKFSDPVMFSPDRIDFLRNAIATNTLPPKLKTKWTGIVAMPDTWTVKGAYNPWNIPENYSDDSATNQEMLANVHADTMAAAKYAFRYVVNGDPADAARVVAIVNQFSAIQTFMTNAGSTLNWFDAWPVLIQAMIMIKGSAAATTTVVNNFKAVLARALNTLEPIAYTRDNNWAAWGLAMEFAAAIYLGNRARFDRAVDRWYYIFDDTIISNFLVTNGGPANGQRKNNVAHREITRMGGGHGNGAYGLLYTAFHLDGMTVAAEWARIGGVWLYDHVAPDGSSLKGLWEEVAYMKRYGAPNLSTDYLKVQWYNTSNKETDPSYKYWYAGYYTNRVGAGFYICQELWPLTTAYELMNGFNRVAIAPGFYPPTPEGAAGGWTSGYGIVQDYYGMYGADLAYWGRPLAG